ncbi:MAG: bifunctional methylenetetrahydrofolate dehydrogenase/methenyltetrahydrofolate cyclohydrolase FolD [Phycisphaeraceae bacterium]
MNTTTTPTEPVIIKGKPVADAILANCEKRVQRIIEKTGVTPCLATVLVGNDPASEKYVDRKGKLCEKHGMKSIKVHMPEDSTTEQVVAKVSELAADKNVHGILVQHPMPKQVDERAVFEAIGGDKDVDGVTFHSFGTMSYSLPGFGSATPEGIMRLMRAYDIPIEGKHAVVIGRSVILGKPMAMLLLAANATVTICHSRTVDLPSIVRQADIVVAAVGKPHFVKGDWLKQGAVVIDAGFNPGPKGNVGDVDYEDCLPRCSMITPVPGGVGPMTLAVLIDQTSIAAARQLGVDVD